MYTNELRSCSEAAHSNSQNRCVRGFGMFHDFISFEELCIVVFLHFFIPHLSGDRRRPASTRRGASTSTAAGRIFRCIFASHRWDPFHGQGQLQHAWQKMENPGTKTKTPKTAVKDLPQLYFHFPSMQKTRSGLKGCTVLEVGITAMKYHCPNT